MDERKGNEVTQFCDHQVAWALDRAYKAAVRVYGINDWMNDFKTTRERIKAQREVEKYQIMIAPLFLTALSQVGRIETV